MKKKDKRIKSYYKQKFYVFYDAKDNIKCCGTVKQLIEDGKFKKANDIYSLASHIMNNRIGGSVVVLK